jgi:hypothetical protein
VKQVEVVWYDVFDIAGWMSPNDMGVNFPPEQRGQLVRTRGWLYSEDENKVIICRDWAQEVDRKDEESIRGAIAIPRGMIVEVIEQ